jgi:hypothetical protein
MAKPKRYAIISDIHSNIEALDAVIADAHAQGVTDFVCLGDVVGYTELAGSIEIDSIPCLEEERILLKQALQEGFYL